MRKNLIEARENLGMSRTDVAEHIGVAYETYYQYEKGIRNPSKKSIDKLEDLFKTPQRKLLKIFKENKS